MVELKQILDIKLSGSNGGEYENDNLWNIAPCRFAEVDDALTMEAFSFCKTTLCNIPEDLHLLKMMNRRLPTLEQLFCNVGTNTLQTVDVCLRGGGNFQNLLQCCSVSYS
jgi:hypothetical protein